MIYAEPTKKGVGVAISGDMRDFRSLHETVHELLDLSPLQEHQQDFILGSLAYELRHAYQGDREFVEVGLDPSEKAQYVQFRIMWPMILFDLAVLRWIAGYTGDKNHQANLYRLEYCVEEALIAYDATVGLEAIKEYQRIHGFSKSFLVGYINECAYEYIYGGSTGKMRFRRLPTMLRSFSELSKPYMEFYGIMWKEAEKHGTTPDQLRDAREWSEFEW